jgi:signal transduction histidine kinase
MSHELRTPLNAIGGYTQLIDLGIRGPVTGEQKEDLARITRSQRHLLSLINDILNYAKLEAGRVSFDIGHTRIEELIGAVDEMVKPQVDAKGIAYTCESGPAGLTVAVDREKTIQILLNLLSNAIKFTPPGGVIHMGVSTDVDLVSISVSDTGPGIPADRQVAIFEPFVQVNRTLSESVEGTGLGLSISRALAQGMGGDLVVKSKPGKGSVFTLTLPTSAVEGPGGRSGLPEA